ncbi:MAG: cobalamin-dependent protein [Clostridiales Family XIII bacterium]|jgi:methanogenic corrinoid protein MtbC1|nr:cobalamin-dependent protein [Clostridiales Family XIII bacterium]
MSNEEILKRIADFVAVGDEEGAVEAVKEAFAAGIGAVDVLNNGAQIGMNKVGEDYSAGVAFLPELVLAGDTFSALLEIIFENMDSAESAANLRGKIVFGQAAGDVHDIGKNIVIALLAVNGFEVIDLGIDVPVKTFYEKAEALGADIIGVSSLLTTSMPYMKDTLQYFVDTDSRKKYRFIVGGGPVTPAYATEIGADGWGRTAFDCVNLCKRLAEAGGTPGGDAPILIDSGKDVIA